MKFACPKCNTRYSISDDKVPAGKILKFPCKTCGNVVRLRRKDGDQAQILDAAMPAATPARQDPIETTRIASVAEINKLRTAATALPTKVGVQAIQRPEEPSPLLSEVGVAPDHGGEATRVVSVDQINILRAAAAETDALIEPEEDFEPARADGKSEPSEWFVLIAGKQRGPITAPAVEAMLAKNEIDKRTFVWKSGMANWERLGGVDRFSGAGAPAPAPAPTPADEPLGAHSFIDEDNQDATVADDRATGELQDLGLGELDEVSSGIFEDNPLNGQPAAAASGSEDITIADEAPEGFYKASTMVVSDPRAFTANLEKSIDDARRSPAVDDDEILGSLTTKGPGDQRPDKRPTEALVGADAQIEESIASLGDSSLASFEDDRPDAPAPSESSGLEPIGQDSEYLEAPPGDSTKLYMEAGGIYKKRRNNRIAAVITALVMLFFVGFVFMDMQGVIVLPGMGAVYDVAGVDDPNIDRALERTENKLAAEDLDPKKRAQLESMRRRLLDKSNQAAGTDTRVDKQKSTVETKNDPAVAPADKEGAKEGVPEEKAPDDQHAMAEQLFNDGRKQEADVKLATPSSIQTPNLPEGLTQEAIYKVVNDNNTSMKLCYAEAARKGEKLAGKMEVQLTIDASGDVTGADINTAQFKTSTMGQCTVRRVKTWKFPHFNGQPVTVVFPYVLQSAF